MKERLTTYHCGKAVIKDKDKLSEAMEKLAKLEDEQEHGGWIPCSERLPDKYMECLVTVSQLLLIASGACESRLFDA